MLLFNWKCLVCLCFSLIWMWWKERWDRESQREVQLTKGTKRETNGHLYVSLCLFACLSVCLSVCLSDFFYFNKNSLSFHQHSSHHFCSNRFTSFDIFFNIYLSFCPKEYFFLYSHLWYMKHVRKHVLWFESFWCHWALNQFTQNLFEVEEPVWEWA